MSGLQSDEHKVPVRINFYSEWGQSVMNLFNFDGEAAKTTAFDVKPCFSWEEQRFIQFALNGKGDILCLCNLQLFKGKNIIILRIWERHGLIAKSKSGSWEHEVTVLLTIYYTPPRWGGTHQLQAG